MKYITGSHYIIIFIVILAIGCSSKKDILSDQSDTATLQENFADNGTKPQEEPTVLTKNKINDIRVSEFSGGIDVFINSDRKPNYTIFKLQKPDRIILDIPDIANEEPPKELCPETGLISTIRSSLMTDKDVKYLRVEIILKSEITYTAQSNDTTITVNIKNKPINKSENADLQAFSSDAAQLLSAENQNIGQSNLVKLQIKNAIPRFTSYKLANPARLVIELENAQNKIQSSDININENFLSKIRFGQKDKNLNIICKKKRKQKPKFCLNQ